MNNQNPNPHNPQQPQYPKGWQTPPSQPPPPPPPLPAGQATVVHAAPQNAGAQSYIEQASSPHVLHAPSQYAQTAAGQFTSPIVGMPAHAQHPPQNPGDVLPFIDAVTFINNPPPRPKTIIEGIMCAGSRMVIAGPSKSFKSWNILDLAVGLATGTEWIGFKTALTRVMYVDFELHPFWLHDRVSKILAKRGNQLTPGALTFLPMRGRKVPIEKLARSIEPMLQGGIEVVVLEPIYKLLNGRAENQAGEIGDLMGEIETMCASSGASAIFTAHFPKGNMTLRESQDRIAGSGVFARDPDALITLTPHVNPESYTVDLTLRNFAPIPSFVLRRDHPIMVRDPEANPEMLRGAPGSKKPGIPTDEEFLAALNPDEPITTTELQGIFVESGWDKNAVARIRNRLKDEGRITVTKGAHGAQLVGLPDEPDAGTDADPGTDPHLEQKPKRAAKCAPKRGNRK